MWCECVSLRRRNQHSIPFSQNILSLCRHGQKSESSGVSMRRFLKLFKAVNSNLATKLMPLDQPEFLAVCHTIVFSFVWSYCREKCLANDCVLFSW